jgi:hypothetical protein
MAKRPRWTRCQSVARPWTAEYWHIGEIATRFLSVRPRRVRGEKSVEDMLRLARIGGGEGGPCGIDLPAGHLKIAI